MSIPWWRTAQQALAESGDTTQEQLDAVQSGVDLAKERAREERGSGQQRQAQQSERN